MTATANENLPLAGRHAVITGANGGIGEAVCLDLAARGATLTLLGLDGAALEVTRGKLPGRGHIGHRKSNGRKNRNAVRNRKHAERHRNDDIAQAHWYTVTHTTK